MSPSAELLFAVIGGSGVLVAVAATMTKAFGWTVKNLIRDELAPVVKELTTEMAAMRTSWEQSQRSQNRGNQELHAITASIRDVLTEHGERIAAVEEKTKGLDTRTETLERSPI